MRQLTAILAAFALNREPSFAMAGGLRLAEKIDTIPAYSSKGSGRKLVDSGYTCFGDHDFQVYLKGECNYNELHNRIALLIEKDDRCYNNARQEILVLLGIEDINCEDPEFANTDGCLVGSSPAEEQAYERVKQICKQAMDDASLDPSKHIPWEEITGYGENFDKSFFDGQSFWNEEYQTDYDTLIPNHPDNKLKTDAERVRDLYETVSERAPFVWPEISNFEQCDIRAAMCCWVSDRQADDNNGNCHRPYDERCTDADPNDNTDVCAVDLSAGGSNLDGVNLFVAETTGPVHCHGFAWGNDDMGADSRYKANNLFYISMYDHLHQRGYVRNIPGAPMCGCVEKMPVVERADCTEIDADEFWKFAWNAESASLIATLDRAEIDFKACRNNDLARHFDHLVSQGVATSEERQQLARNVVGNNNCEAARKVLMYDKGLEVSYPPVVMHSGDGNLFSIKVADGTSDGYDYLYTSTAGSLRLQANTLDNKAKWRLDVLNADEGNLFNIRTKPGAADKNYLFSDYWGNVRMEYFDDHTGRHKFYLKRVPGYTDMYNIIVSGGTYFQKYYLSASTNGYLHLHHEDDESGRQRWIIEELEETFELADYSKLTNVALNKQTTQKSTCHGGSSHRAVDGNISGHWHHGSVTHTCGEQGAWWEVDLAKGYNIEHITIYNRIDCCHWRLNGFTVDILDDQDETVWSYTAGVAVRENQIAVLGEDDSIVTGSKVRISLPENRYEYLSLAEVQVYAETAEFA